MCIVCHPSILEEVHLVLALIFVACVCIIMGTQINADDYDPKMRFLL
jgi:hypothetical protein